MRILSAHLEFVLAFVPPNRSKGAGRGGLRILRTLIYRAGADVSLTLVTCALLINQGRVVDPSDNRKMKRNVPIPRSDSRASVKPEIEDQQSLIEPLSEVDMVCSLFISETLQELDTQ